MANWTQAELSILAAREERNWSEKKSKQNVSIIALLACTSLGISNTKQLTGIREAYRYFRMTFLASQLRFFIARGYNAARFEHVSSQK